MNHSSATSRYIKQCTIKYVHQTDDDQYATGYENLKIEDFNFEKCYEFTDPELEPALQRMLKG